MRTQNFSWLNSRPLFSFIFFSLLLAARAHSELVTYELEVSESTVNYTGKPVTAITVNGGIPGPTIEATIGDTLRVEVHNKLAEETSVHWHGILLPNDQDGVPYLTTPPVPAGGSLVYEFPVIHTGTYWYHSHTGLQEQKGVYGAIVFHPENRDKHIEEHVVVFSDWTNENPNNVLRNLKRDDDYYALKKDSVQSWYQVIRHGLPAIKNRVNSSWTRMGPMDISDVGYDAFLANGQHSIDIVHPIDIVHSKDGRQVRLRLINASASSYLNIRYSGGPMQIISADGIDVEPLDVEEITMAIAETYDIVLQIPENGRYELRATSLDGTGYSQVWLQSDSNSKSHSEQHNLEDYRPPNPYLNSHMMHAGDEETGHSGMDHGDMSQDHTNHSETNHSGKSHSGQSHSEMPHPNVDTDHMDHSQHMAMSDHTETAPSMPDHDMSDHSMPVHSAATHPMPAHPMPDHSVQGHSMESSPPDEIQKSLGQYINLRSLTPTSFNNDRPVREVELRLTGSMDGYRWQFNDVPLSAADRIKITRGEVVRFSLKNETMMNHPIHLHGHFFRVLTDAGDYSPMKHTVNVPAMQTVTIEFAADLEKDWFLHCHNLYHMKAGMSRVIRYDDYQGTESLPSTIGRVRSADNQFWGFADIQALSNFGELGLWAFNNRHEWALDAETGWKDDMDWQEAYEIDAQYRYRLNRFTQVFLGTDWEREQGEGDIEKGENEGIATLGLHYVLPGLIDSEWRVDSDGKFRLGLESELQLTSRLSADWHWNTDSEHNVSLSWEFNKKLALVLANDSDFDAGIGLEIRL